MDSAFVRALKLLISLDYETFQIVSVSVRLALSSTLFASLLSIPAGILLGFSRSRSVRVIKLVLNSLMAIPTVVIGLFVYSLLSRSGPLGSMGLLFTRGAIIIGQTLLIFPIITSMVLGVVQSIDPILRETLTSYNITGVRKNLIILREVKTQIFLAITAGFGRVLGEVGVSMMLGGNIRWFTRTITTSIALETSKGNFEQGLALGIILLVISLGINFVLHVSVKNEA
ncbi:MAG: ABC transporter permease [Spirochaetales bacterium]|jgi:tungstate transport system permease protein|nr:ABC transporter permease [Spirochaetales bacterium]